MFADIQGDLFEKPFEEKVRTEKNRPVECLGITFPNDEGRRKYFLDKLKEKLKDPEFRKIEGFPIGSDENILSLSTRRTIPPPQPPSFADFIKLNDKPKPWTRYRGSP